MKKVLLLFGAGASYGSDLCGTPPLTLNLFNELKAFHPNIWNQIPIELENIFISDFETGMSNLSDNNPTLLPILQRSMASYFFKFEPKEENLYRKLAKKIKSTRWKGIVVTINYDRLLTKALVDEGLTIKINNSNFDNSINLILPHGCCNLFNENVKGLPKNIKMNGLRVKTNLVGISPVLKNNPKDFYSAIKTNAFPPIMSYIESGKSTMSGVDFITEQRRLYEKEVLNSDLVCIVGVKINPRDKHIWLPLQNTSAELVYCSGKDWKEFENWSKKFRRYNTLTIFKGYFREFSNDIFQFLEL